MAGVTEINDSNFEASLAAREFCVVDVFASWCGSCRMLAPTFAEIAAANQNVAAFYKIDGEENPKFCDVVPIDNLPFIAVFHNGKYVGGKSLTKREALEEIVAMIPKRSAP